MKEKEEIVVDGEIENKTRIFIYVGILIGVLVVGFLIGFLVLRGGGDVGDDGGDGGDEMIFNLAIENKNISECDGLDNPKDSVRCKILVGVGIGDESFCEGKFNESFNYPITFFSMQENLIAKDYCWTLMAFTYGKKYCNFISVNNIRKLCMEVLNE